MCAKHTVDNDLQPRDLCRGVDRLDAPDKDLQRALIGVERVVVAQGRLAGDAHQRALVASDHPCYPCLRFVGEGVDPSDNQRLSPP